MTSTDHGAAAAVDGDVDLAALEQDREFLIRSLRDLDAEHEAGDMDESDYQQLSADYIARTAAVLRALERATPPRPAPRPRATGSPRESGVLERALLSRRRWRRAAVATIVVGFGALATWAVAQSSGTRQPGQTASGNGQASSTAPSADGLDPRLAQAATLVNQGKVADALRMYDDILVDEPDQPVALANDGWLLAQAGMAGSRADLVDAGLAKIVKAEYATSSYPAAHFFRGFLLLRAKHDPSGAVTELRAYLGSADPSGSEIPQVEELLQEAIMAVGSGAQPGPSTTPAP